MVKFLLVDFLSYAYKKDKSACCCIIHSFNQMQTFVKTKLCRYHQKWKCRLLPAIYIRISLYAKRNIADKWLDFELNKLFWIHVTCNGYFFYFQILIFEEKMLKNQIHIELWWFADNNNLKNWLVLALRFEWIFIKKLLVYSEQDTTDAPNRLFSKAAKRWCWEHLM